MDPLNIYSMFNIETHTIKKRYQELIWWIGWSTCEKMTTEKELEMSNVTWFKVDEGMYDLEVRALY